MLNQASVNLKEYMSNEEKKTNKPRSVEVLREIIKLKANGETRKQQEEIVDAIEDALNNNESLIVEGPTGSGKALDITTPILTNKGWSTMRELQIGDIVFNEKGEETTITHIYPILNNKTVYEIVFNDGSKINADAEHLWSTSTRLSRSVANDFKKNKRINLSSENIADFKQKIKDDKSFWIENNVISPLVVSRHYKIPYALVLDASSSLNPVFIKRNIKYFNTRELFEAIYIKALDSLKDYSGNVKLKTVTTQQLLETLHHNTHKNHAIPIIEKAVDFPEQDLLIHPYILGAWLGAGDKNCSGLTCFDQDILDAIEGYGYIINQNKTLGRYSIATTMEKPNSWHGSLTTGLRKIGVLNNKHIPINYLMSSESQRRELLTGLLDTNGSININGEVEFYTYLSSLRDDVYQLIVSLGYKATIRIENIVNKETMEPYKTAYTISFKVDPNEDKTIFNLGRKQVLIKERNKNYTSSRNNLRYVVEVNEIESVPVRCITVDSPSHLFLAGRSLIPTHNSLAYLLPVILSEKKTIVSTATKQLSEQLNDNEMPFLQKSLLKTYPELTASSYALLKGRDNYYCYRKADIQAELDKKETSQAGFRLDMFDEISDKGKEASREMKLINEWADDTQTGDRSEGPVVSDATWRNYSSTSTECPGAQICPFGEQCFAERARAQAREAQIVITNHAMVAHDLSTSVDEGNILGDREVVVFDELHELENYLSSAWSANITTKQLTDFMRELKKSKEIKDNILVVVEESIRTIDIQLEKVENGIIETMPLAISEALRTIQKHFLNISSVLSTKTRGNVVSNKTKEIIASLKKRTDELSEQILLVLDNSVKTVRWFNVPEEPKFKRKGVVKTEKVITISAAPLLVGPRLQEYLKEKNMRMIGTSATVRVAGKFDIPIHNLGLDKVKEHKTIAVDSPFDFSKQGMIYIPDKSFPAPVGSERKEHSAATQEATLELVQASGGRALVLTTTTYDANEMAKYLRVKLKRKKIKVLLQGDAPQKQLVAEFAKDETSILVATMGLWHGLDIQGSSLSLVVITKVPFKPMNDPLSVARQKYAEEQGRNGFMDVYVASANVMLSQGTGRLIRHTTDRGVVAILDTRLLSKSYGKAMLKSLPNMKIFTNKTIVINALKRLTANADK